MTTSYSRWYRYYSLLSLYFTECNLISNTHTYTRFLDSLWIQYTLEQTSSRVHIVYDCFHAMTAELQSSVVATVKCCIRLICTTWCYWEFDAYMWWQNQTQICITIMMTAFFLEFILKTSRIYSYIFPARLTIKLTNVCTLLWGETLWW